MDSELILITDPCGDDIDAALQPADATEPHILVTDLGVNRGDGIFELCGAIDGRIQGLAPHLARLARSAQRMAMPKPNLAIFEEGVRRVAKAFTERHPGEEALVKLVMTRGQEVGESPLRPRGWVLAYPALDHTRWRNEGVDVVLLTRGLSALVEESPWLLGGVKSLSYAINRAAVREAAHRRADDAIYVSSDGHLLEGTTSSLVLKFGDELVTPPASEGILPGVTVGDVFALAPSLGLRTTHRVVMKDELWQADAAWFTASTRLATPIRSIEGRPFPMDMELTRAFIGHLINRDS